MAPTTVSTLIDGEWVPWDVTSNPTPPIDPPTNGMMVGLDPSLNGVDQAPSLYLEIRRVCGTLGIDPDMRLPIGNHMKFYDGGNGLRRAVANYENSLYDGVPVLCHKQDNKADYQWRLDNITKPEVWVFWQEKGFDKGPSDAVYNAGYKHMDEVRRSHPNGHLVSLLMDGSRSQESRQKDAQPNFEPAAAHVDYIGLDCYRYGGKGTVAPQQEFKELLEWHQAVVGTYPEYKGFTVPEFGLGRDIDANGVVHGEDARAAELEADFQWLSDHGCVWVNYWEEDNPHNGGTSHYWATGNSPNPAPKNVLTSWITREELN